VVARVLKTVPIRSVREEKLECGGQLTLMLGGWKTAKHVVAQERYPVATGATMDGLDELAILKGMMYE